LIYRKYAKVIRDGGIRRIDLRDEFEGNKTFSKAFVVSLNG
jgi:hypothetical protein